MRDRDKQMVARYALGGLLTGSGAAALLNLIRVGRESAIERKKKLSSPTTDEDTIVINLPTKAGAVIDKSEARSADLSGATQGFGEQHRVNKVPVREQPAITPTDEPTQTVGVKESPATSTIAGKQFDAMPGMPVPSSTTPDSARSFGLNIAKAGEAGMDGGDGNIQDPTVQKQGTKAHGTSSNPADQRPPSNVSEPKQKHLTTKVDGRKREAGTGRYADTILEDLEKNSAAWPTITAAILAALGSGVVGAETVNKLFQVQREKQLKDELAAAKQQYVGYLTGEKKAFEDLFYVPGTMSKEAQGMLGMLNIPLATAALFGILGSGGMAYVTKKILDDKLREAESKGRDFPKVKRIIFTTRGKDLPGEDAAPEEAKAMIPGEAETVTPEVMADKAAMVIENPDVFTAMVGVTMDSIADTRGIIGHPVIIKMAQAAGVMPKQMSDVDHYKNIIFAALQNNPELSKAVASLAMQQHPMLKHFTGALGIPFVRTMANKRIMKGIDAAMTPELKAASMMPVTTPALIAGMVGGNLLNEQTTPDQMATAMFEAEQKKKELEAEEKDKPTAEEEAKGIKIEAKGKTAKKYLERNKAKVQAILKRMAEEGQL